MGNQSIRLLICDPLTQDHHEKAVHDGYVPVESPEKLAVEKQTVAEEVGTPAPAQRSWSLAV